MGGEGQPTPVQVVELTAIVKLLQKTANKTSVEVQYENGEPRLTFIFTDRDVAETKKLLEAFRALASALTEQAYEEMGVWRKQKGGEESKTKDINIA